jgi:hypothetical protein
MEAWPGHGWRSWKSAVATAQRSQKQSEALVPETVPFITDQDRAAIRTDYLPALDHKALAISQSRIGFITGQADDETANPTFPTGALILEFCRQKLNLFKGR